MQLYQGYGVTGGILLADPGRHGYGTVEKDLSGLSVGLNMAWRPAQDRKQW